MKTAAHFFEAVTFVACLCGALILLGAFAPEAGSPQVAAIAALAIAVGAIPYMLAGIFHRMAVRGMLEKHFAERDG